MAGESPVSIAVRRLARARPDIGRALFGSDSRLPMVFQYNPLIHYMEVNALGEVICTVSRLDLLAPRIRYNVHDSGGIVDFARGRGGAARASGSTSTGSTRRPRSTAHAGRCPGPARSRCRSSGSTAGATRRSASWARTSTPRTSRRSSTATRRSRRGCTRSCSSVVDDETGTPRPVGRGRADATSTASTTHGVAAAAERLRDGLGALNIDYRSSLGEFPGAMLPIVSTYARRRGPVRRRRDADQAAADRHRTGARAVRLVAQQAPQRGLDPLLERRADRRVGEGRA